MSDGGAWLEFGPSSIPPDQFELICDLDGFKADCEVMHRSATGAGVRFIGGCRDIPKTRIQVVRDPGTIRGEEQAAANEDPSPQAAHPVHQAPGPRRANGGGFGKRR